jgi:hypothetical protein
VIRLLQYKTFFEQGLLAIFIASLCWNCPEHTDYILPKRIFQECSSAVLIVMVLYAIISGLIKQGIRSAAKHHGTILLILFGVLYLASFIKQAPATLHLSMLESKWCFIVLPIVLLSWQKYWQENQSFYLKVFIVSCMAAMLYCEVQSIYNYVDLNCTNSSALIYELLSIPIMMPSLLSNFIVIGFIILSIPFLQKNIVFLFSKKIQLFLVLFFFVFIVQLTLKIVFLFLFFYFIWWYWHAYKNSTDSVQKKKLGITFLAAFFFILIFMRLMLWQRIAEIFQGIHFDNTVLYAQSIKSRLAAWYVSLQLIAQQPFIGYGGGKANEVMRAQFAADGYLDLIKYKMRTHQQFIHIALDFGIAGLLLICSSLVLFFREFLLRKNSPAFFCLFWIVLNCLCNDILEYNAGSMCCITMLYIFNTKTKTF